MVRAACVSVRQECLNSWHTRTKHRPLPRQADLFLDRSRMFRHLYENSYEKGSREMYLGEKLLTKKNIRGQLLDVVCDVPRPLGWCRTISKPCISKFVTRLPHSDGWIIFVCDTGVLIDVLSDISSSDNAKN